MMLIAFKETHQVQIFESSNGHFTHDFCFFDNVFNQVQNHEEGNEKTKVGRGTSIKGERAESIKEKEKREKKVNPADELEYEFKKSGLTRPEFNYHKRKIEREKGEYCPEIPAYTRCKDGKASHNNKYLGRTLH
jgi:hypothetical protein